MQDDRRQELTDRFAESAEYLNRQLHTGRLDEWEGLDMTIPQIRTLVLLERMGPLRMGNIAIYLDSSAFGHDYGYGPPGRKGIGGPGLRPKRPASRDLPIV